MNAFFQDHTLSSTMLAIVLQVTALAAATLLAAYLVKRHAALRYHVLFMALLCILATPFICGFGTWSRFSIEIPLLVEPGNPTALPTSATFVSSVIDTTQSIGQHPSVPRSNNGPADRGMSQSSPSITSLGRFVDGSLFSKLSRHAGDIAAAVWLLGTIVCALGVVRSWQNIATILRDVKPFDTNAYRSEIHEASVALGVEQFPRIGTTSGISGPVVVGRFGRPWVLIPTGFEKTISRPQLVQILIHEGAHAIRRDPVVLLLQQICRALFWWHPLIVVNHQGLDQAREELCDNFVLQHTHPANYGETLLQLTLLSGKPSHSLAAVGMLETRWKLEHRIRGILDGRRTIETRLGRSTAGLVLTIFVLVSTFLQVRLVSALPPQRAEQPATKKNDSPRKQTHIGKMMLVAVDSDTGKTLRNAEFVINLGQKGTVLGHGDKDGKWIAQLSSKFPRLCEVRVKVAGYTPMRATWRNGFGAEPDELPKQFSFSMVKGIKVGGQVIDEDGKPVPGATVRFSAGARQAYRGRREQQSFSQETYQTDKEGRWVCPIAPKNIDTASILANHPDFAQDATNYGIDHQSQALREFKQTVTLAKGILLQGRVINWDGRPIKGAILGVGELNAYRHQGPFAETDADGHYRFPAIAHTARLRPNAKWPITVAVIKPGYAPEMQAVPNSSPIQIHETSSRERVVDFLLKRGETITIQVTNSDRLPIQGAWVIPEIWRTTDALQVLGRNLIPRETNVLGEWKWTWAPPDKIEYDVAVRDYMRIRNQPIRVSDDVFPLTLKRPQVILGKVVDAGTKKPIGKFFIQKGWPGFRQKPDGIYWEGIRTTGINGKYRKRITMPAKAYHYRITADGYATHISKLIPVTEGDTALDFELKKTTN